MRQLKSLFKWHMGAWWLATTSSIVGTITGIIVTFGTSAYLEEKKHEENQRLVVMMVLNNIEIYNRRLSKDIAVMEKNDSLFQAIMQYSDEKVRSVSKDTALMFLNSLGSRSFRIVNHTSEKIFSSSMSTWQSIDNTAFIENVGKCYSLINLMEDLYQGIVHEQFNLYDEFHKTHDIRDFSTTEKFALLHKQPDVIWYLQKHHMFYLPFLKGSIETLLEQQKKNLEMMKISEEELIQFIRKNVNQQSQVNS